MRARDRLLQALADLPRRMAEEDRQNQDRVIAEFGGNMQVMAAEVLRLGGDRFDATRCPLFCYDSAGSALETKIGGGEWPLICKTALPSSKNIHAV